MRDRTIATRMQGLRIDIRPDVAERQVTAIRQELRDAPTTVTRSPVARGWRRRRLALTIAVVTAVLLPTAALAAEQTVPGDVLYPVKQSTEWARSFFDVGVAGRHRVQELEIVIDRDASVTEVEERYRAAVDAADDDPVLMDRIVRARERVRARYGIDPAGQDPTSTSPGAGRGDPQGGQDREGQAGTAPGDAADPSAPSPLTTTETTIPSDGTVASESGDPDSTDGRTEGTDGQMSSDTTGSTLGRTGTTSGSGSGDGRRGNG